MKELITKSPDGNYTLTDAGEQELYLITTRKLIQYYLKEILKKDTNSIAVVTNSLTIFIFNNFKKVDDYLKKLPELANFIQETNLEKFQKFMGQYFINTLQKEKQVLIKKESEQAKEKLDNPFWAPSNEMLKKLESEFTKVSPLNFSTDGQAAPAPEKTDKKENKVPAKLPISGDEPGVIIFQTLGKSFLAAKPLDVKSFESKEEAQFGDINNEDDFEVKTQKSNTAPDAHDSLFLEPPGVRLLSEFESAFVKSPPLEMTPGKIVNESRSDIAETQHLITIKAYATILSNISKFSKNKDTAGYQNWYGSLDPRLRAVVKMNSLFNTEKKGDVVNWGQEIMSYAATTNVNKDELYQLTEELKLYAKLVNYIRHRLTSDPKIKLSPPEASNIYTQSINILSGNESSAEKKSALTILLFQVTDPTMREILLKDFEKILSALG
jgi:hypothetical protein